MERRIVLLQVLEGEKQVESILYDTLETWIYDEKKKILEIKVNAQKGGKKAHTLKLSTPDGEEAAILMTENWKKGVQAKQAASQEKKDTEKAMCGEYKVVATDGAEVLRTEKLDSAKVGVIAAGEIVSIDRVITKFEGSMKTRLHVSKTTVKQHEGSSETEMEGWITLKTVDGAVVERADPNADEPSTERSADTTTPVEPAVDRTIEAVDSDENESASVSTQGEESPMQPEGGNTEFMVAQVKKNPYKKKS